MVRQRAINIAFALVSLAALASFAWPLLIPATASADSGYLVVIAVFALSFAVVWLFDRSVLAVNYRGSSGRGAKFSRSIWADNAGAMRAGPRMPCHALIG